MKLLNPPKQILAETYHDALEQYINKLRKIPQVRTIATMGSIGAPGLSDLDVIVVVDDDFLIQESHHLVTTGINHDIFIHGPVIIPASMAESLPYIIYATNLITHYGNDKINLISDIPSEDSHILNLAYLIDFCESRLCQCAQLEKYKSLNQRQWATRLWSLTHSYQISQQVGLEWQPESKQTIQNLHNFRQSWNDNSYFDADLFLKIFERFQSINREIFIKALTKLYTSFEDVIPIAKHQHIGEKIFHFLPAYNDCQHKYSELSLLHKKVRYYAVDASSTYQLHFQQYGFLPMQQQVGILEPLKKRAEIVQQHWAWLSEHARLSHSMSGYLGARPFIKGKFSTLVKQNIISLAHKVS